MKRIHWLRIFQTVVAFALFISGLPATVYAADNYPSRPVSLICGVSAGGATDIILKTLTDPVSKILNQPVSTVFKPGGGTSVSLALLKGEKPDGYSIGYFTIAGSRSALLRKVPYDPIEDFTYIAQVGEWQFVIIDRPDSPWKNIKELLKYAKDNPGKIRYGTPGVGMAGHLAMEKLGMDLGINWKHVPFEGDVGMTTALLGGHIEVLAGGPGGFRSYIEAKKMRPLAVFMEKPVETFPGLPTLKELGYNVITPGPFGFIGPKGMAESTVIKLQDAFKKSMSDPLFIKTADTFGVSPTYRGSKEFTDYMQKTVTDDKVLLSKMGLMK